MDLLQNAIQTIERRTTIFFVSASLFAMLLLFQAIVLTWLSQFKILYLSLSVLISFILTVISFHGISKDIYLFPRINIKVVVIIIFICLLGTFSPHETFGGRDEGSYSNIAVMLSKNANLLFSPYIRSVVGNNYREDTQNVVAASTPGYYVWLAVQNVFFGIGWMLRSNIILVSLGLCSLFFVVSAISKQSLGFITVVLYASSMPFLWFFRETMSENLAFFLLWASLAFLLAFFKTRQAVYLGGLMLGTWLFSFTRLEGVLILFSTFIVFTLLLLISKIFSFQKNIITILVYLIVISSSLLIQKPFKTDSFLRTNIHNVEYVINKSISIVQVANSTKRNTHAFSNNEKLVDKIPFFSFQMLTKYNLAIILLSLFLTLPTIIKDKKMSKTDKIYFAALFTILLPEFYKFLNPSVTMEQPWMYRRYLYALLPMGYICFTIFLKKLLSRKFMLLFVFILFAFNMLLSSNILLLKNNWSTTAQLDKIIKNISPADDLVIIDGWTLLDNYYPSTYLNYNRGIRALVHNSVSSKLWTPKAKKYNDLDYNNLYLISDKGPESFKNYNVTQVDSVEVKYIQLQPNCTLGTLNDELGLPSGNLYLLPYKDAVGYCSKTDNKILDVQKKIYLYKLIDQNI